MAAFAAVAALTVLQPQTAKAQATSGSGFPSKPITIVTPGGPGGLLDTVARLIGEELQKSTGQAVVVEAKPGANGIVAINRLKQSPADGHTIMLGMSQVLQNVIVQENVSYKLSEFSPITMMAIHPIMLASSANNNGKTLPQVIGEMSAKK